MQSNPKFSPLNHSVPLAEQASIGYMQNAPVTSIFGVTVPYPAAKPTKPVDDFEIQSSVACPRNFIIFDQSYNRSQVMFHPAMASKFSFRDLDPPSSRFQVQIEKELSTKEETNLSSFLKDDSDDIDALLSYEEHEGSDDEEVSTARTDANYGSSSPDSCSNYEPRPKKCRLLSFRKSTCSANSQRGRKRQKVREMVNALKGIVPGANRMNTVSVLDEAVRYLKSLKVEVQNLGNLGNDD